MAIYEKTSEKQHRKEETREEGTSKRIGQETEEEKRELQK